MKNMIFFVALAAIPVALGGPSTAVARAEAPQAAVESDVIARVGDQAITFGEINTMLNSSAVVGLSIPALGTPERDTVRITLLDKFISANLLYLDALKQGVDKDAGYQKEVKRFSDAILAGRYQDLHIVGETSVSEKQIQQTFKAQAKQGTELTEQTRMQIEAMLRKQQRKAQMAAAQQALREGVELKVYEDNLYAAGDADRADSTPLAEIGTETLTWGETKDRIIAAGKGAVLADPMAMEDEARRVALQREIDLRIVVQQARAAGLESDPLYQRRLDEYRKTRLINLHRERLIQSIEPDDEALKAYYEENRAALVIPEARKVHMVVVKTEAEATDLKGEIEAGKMTMYQAARNHSIAVNAKQDLGEVGWINQGDMAPALDEAIFALGPGAIGGPVETPAGWHLVTVLDMADAKYTDIEEAATRERTRRRYLDERLSTYVVDLRKNDFSVEVYEDRLVQLAQQEADMVKTLTEKAQQPGSVTEERLEELKKFVQPQ